MRPPHRTLNRQQVHRSAARFLQDHLPLRPYRRSVTVEMLWAVLLVTAAEVSSLHATCQWLDGIPAGRSADRPRRSLQSGQRVAGGVVDAPLFDVGQVVTDGPQVLQVRGAGVVGLSVGGYRSALLAAADERIRAAITVGWMCGLGDLWPVGRWPNSVNGVASTPQSRRRSRLSCPSDQASVQTIRGQTA